MIINFLAKSLKTKKAITAFLITSFIFLSPISFAFNDASKQEKQITTFGHIKKYSTERWPAIYTGAIIGGNLCGAWCVLIFGALSGTIDGAANHFGYSTKNYFTRGMWGLVIGSKINPYSTSIDNIISSVRHLQPINNIAIDVLKASSIPALGFVVGALIPTGILQQIPTNIIAPIASFAIGDSWPSKTAGIVDEITIAKNYTDNHYLTFALTGKKIADLITTNPAITYPSAFIGICFAYFLEKDFIEKLQSTTKIHQEAYETYNEILPKDYLDLQAENHDTFFMGSSLLQEIARIEISKLMGKIGYAIAHKNWDKVYDGIKSMAILSILPIYTSLSSKYLNDHFNEDLTFNLDYELHPKLPSINTTEHPNAKRLIDSASSDSKKLVSGISDLRTTAISSLLEGVSGIKITIETGSPAIPAIALITNQIHSYIANILSSKTTECDRGITQSTFDTKSLAGKDDEIIKEIMGKYKSETKEKAIQQATIKTSNHTKQCSKYNSIKSAFDSFFRTSII